MTEATKEIEFSHPQVTDNSGSVERVVYSTIASMTTLQAGALTDTSFHHVHGGHHKSLTERLKDAYKYELEPEEKTFLDGTARQFGERLNSKE